VPGLGEAPDGLDGDVQPLGRFGAIGQFLGNGKPVSRQTIYRALGMLST